MTLTNHVTGESIQIIWDPGVGSLTGPDARKVNRMIAYSGDDVCLFGIGAPIPVPRPLTTPLSMALIFFSFGFGLPDDLARLVKAKIRNMLDETPDDAVN